MASIYDLLMRLPFVGAVILTAIGLYITLSSANLIKRLVGLGILQTAIFLFFLMLGKIEGGTVPIVDDSLAGTPYANALPQVLILTAIVVAVSTLAVGLAIVVRIRESYGTIEIDEVLHADKPDSFRPEGQRPEVRL
jgi:multicomponent Na+:H+ antiporter subunit C